MRLLGLPFLLALAACAAVPATGPDPASIRILLDGLRDPNEARRKAATQMLRDLGPEASPALRAVLTRRDGPADPLVKELLGSTEPGLRKTAIGHLLLRGAVIEPDLWEAMFTTDSSEVVLLCVELLMVLEGDRPPPALVTDTLFSWGSIPAARATIPPAGKGIAVVRITDSGRRFGGLQDDWSLSQQDQDLGVLFFPEVKVEETPDPPDYKQR